MLLTTKFPVVESFEAYKHGTIGPEEVEVNVNAPVTVSFDSANQAYTFDLPYLFLINHQGNSSIYSLQPPTLDDRTKYATNVADHWECKSVDDNAVTYRFLMCRSTTLSRDPVLRLVPPAFGASAYWILSDGREATSNVRLEFNDAAGVTHIIGDDAAAGTNGGTPRTFQWEIPDG